MADVAFTTSAFKATGTPTARTIPDRLAETGNVRDFGAKGDGVTDDWQVISDAYNHGQVILTVTTGNQEVTFTGVIVDSTLSATSVSGTIVLGKVFTGAGVDFNVIVSQTSGPTGGAGDYALAFAQTLSSRAMSTINNVLTFAGGVPASITTLMYAYDVTNPTVFNSGNPIVSSTTGTTVTLATITGLIQAGDQIAFRPVNKGTIFFPAGTYLVSKPIIMEGKGFNLVGVGDASVITGNFADYILRRKDSDSIPNGPLIAIEALKIVNPHASGGGIQIGNVTLGAVRECTVIANKGIQIASDGTPAPATGPLDMSIENCSVSPGSNVSGSIGIMSLANGPIYNCRIIGYESGMRLWGNENNYNVLGCYFEGNLVAMDFGRSADGSQAGSGAIIASGCWFKNNGTAIKFGNFTPNVAASGGGIFTGIRIEADENVTIFGSRPQYGILLAAEGCCGFSIFAGITVTGQYDQYGIYLGTDANATVTWMGVRSVNTSTHGGLGAWRLPTSSASLAEMLIECNVAQVSTVAALPASPLEGDAYNVSDCNTATWGATAASGGSNHDKVRWSGSNWTVVGK